MISSYPAILILWTVLLGLSQAARDLGWHDGDSDLTSFKTRPELKVPKFNVTIHGDPKSIAPGYWFVAPYGLLHQDQWPLLYYQPCQTGPAIYDQTGELVWTGSCLVKNQNTFDFRPWKFNGRWQLSAILYKYLGIDDRKGHAVVMDDAFEITRTVQSSAELTTWNMHELLLKDEGKKAVYLTWQGVSTDLSMLEAKGVDVGWVGDNGILKMDLDTNHTDFEWWAVRGRHISPAESYHEVKDHEGPWPKVWDFLHLNSIHENEEGDYLVSGRYTDTIYKLDGRSGDVIWRLGGKSSSFTMENFTFSRQHNAQTLSINATTEVISLLDNASDDVSILGNYSSAKIVALDRKHMTARLMQEIVRPDGQLTLLRGNYQILDNGNHFICWSDNSYISEHSLAGQLLMEARFASKRFVTYRAYKSEFVGRPSEPIAVVAEAHGLSPDDCVLAVWVSWNGATEVKAWRIYGTFGPDASFSFLVEEDKTGFETVLYASEFVTSVYVEGVGRDGRVLGTSNIIGVDVPIRWNDIGDIRTGEKTSFGVTPVSRPYGSNVSRITDLRERFHVAEPLQRCLILAIWMSGMAVSGMVLRTLSRSLHRFRRS